MKRLLKITMILLCFLGYGTSQTESFRPADLVNDAIQNQNRHQASIFNLSQNRTAIVPNEVNEYDLLDINYSVLSNLISEERIGLLEITIPTESRNDLILELVPADIHSTGGYVTTMPQNESIKVSQGKHFRGIVKGNSRSLVSISIFENEVMGFISEGKNSNLVIGKLDGDDRHIIYQDADLKDILGFSCDTAESDFEYSPEELAEVGNMRALTDCVRIYLEVDYDIYQDKGSDITAVTNFITGLFNQVATMYANEQINVVLSPLTIWTQPSPYNSTSSSGMLNAFLANTGAFDGDLAQLLSYKASLECILL